MHNRENAAKIKKIFDRLPPDVAIEVINFSNEIHPQYKDRLLSVYLLLVQHIYAIDREQTSGIQWEYASNGSPDEHVLVLMDYDGVFMLGKLYDDVYYKYPEMTTVLKPHRWRYLHV